MKKIINNFYLLTNYEKTFFLLGFLGIIPFIIGLIDLWLYNKNSIFSINIPKYYGVIILTFLGSIYWGIILNQNNNTNVTNAFKIITLIWSITPALLSIGILLIDNNISLVILSFGYLLCHIVDEVYNKILFFPKWYILLRRILSLTVIIILTSCYLIIKS